MLTGQGRPRPLNRRCSGGVVQVLFYHARVPNGRARVRRVGGGIPRFRPSRSVRRWGLALLEPAHQRTEILKGADTGTGDEEAIWTAVASDRVDYRVGKRRLTCIVF